MGRCPADSTSPFQKDHAHVVHTGRHHADRVGKIAEPSRKSVAMFLSGGPVFVGLPQHSADKLSV
jgi:hypothetical protein